MSITHEVLALPSDPAVGVQDGMRSENVHRDRFRVLLLEDNEGNAMVFEGFLETMCDPDVVNVTSIAELDTYADEICNGNFDLVVFDVMLPDGESTGKLANLSRLSPTPFCAYTARVTPVDFERIKQAGALHVFAKPLSYPDFTRHIEPIIARATEA